MEENDTNLRTISNELRDNMNWTPPLSFEEKLKKLLLPTSLYLRILVKKKLRKGESELHFLSFMTNKNKGSIDIGANKGVFTYLLSKMSNKIHAFEPNPKMYSILKNARIKNTLTYKVALSDKSGITELLVPMNVKTNKFSNQGASLSKVKVSGASRSVQVEEKTLDSYKFENIGFIKIDVEGYEMQVLKGAKNTLIKNKPVLMIELEEGHTKRPIEDLIREVEEYGYKALFLKKKQLTDISLFDPDRNHRNPKNREDYVFNFIFLPVKN